MKVPTGRPLIDVADITEIELRILRRMREYTLGEHASVFKGSGFDFVGLRDWEPGDRPSSTRCGLGGVPIAAGIARAVATIGLSAAFLQDMFGLMTFDEGFQHLTAVPPRTGKNHVIYCLESYQHGTGASDIKRHADLSLTIGGLLPKTCLIPVVSDFLFDDARSVLRDLSDLNARHDVFLVVVDSAFAFELPDAPAGWIEAYDVETGRSSILSRTELRHLAQRIRAWQDDIERWGKDADLDVLRLGPSPEDNLHALLEFVVERRLRKV